MISQIDEYKGAKTYMIQSGYSNRLSQIRYENIGALKRYKDEKWGEYEIEHELDEKGIYKEDAIKIAPRIYR